MRRWIWMVIGWLVVTLITSGVAATAGNTAPAVLPAVDRQVRFVVDGTTTYGTVHVPAHQPGTKLAAALLIPGSGPTDRDGNAPPTVTPATLKLIAGVLADDGVMSLRFDKYFTGRTGAGRYQGDPSRIDMGAFTRQAVAAYASMATQPEADPRALLIVGHSEGGLQALLTARRARPTPAGLALLAPQDLRTLDLLDYQLTAGIDQAVTQGTISPEQGEADKAGVVRAIVDFRAGRPLHTTGTSPTIAAALHAWLGPEQARFFRSDDAIYPPDVARHVKAGTRVALTCGTADWNLPCWTTTPLLDALTQARTRGPGLVVLPGLDHFFHLAGTPINSQTLAPAARQALHNFVRPWQRPYPR